MIFHNADIARSMTWSTKLDESSGETARSFLYGEKELLKLAQARSSAVVALSAFLEASVELPLTVHRADSGEVLVRAGASAHTLLVTGKTASVLSSYLDDAPVRMQDRFDMTVRRLANA
jgi:hypothetical protein